MSDEPSARRVSEPAGGEEAADRPAFAVRRSAPSDRRPVDAAEANGAVSREVASWEGVSVHGDPGGLVEFRLGRRSLGHLHAGGRNPAHLPFPRRVRDELVAAGRARPHPAGPETGWVAAPMGTAAEVAGAIELFRQSYARAVKARRRP